MRGLFLIILILSINAFAGKKKNDCFKLLRLTESSIEIGNKQINELLDNDDFLDLFFISSKKKDFISDVRKAQQNAIINAKKTKKGGSSPCKKVSVFGQLQKHLRNKREAGYKGNLIRPANKSYTVANTFHSGWQSVAPSIQNVISNCLPKVLDNLGCPNGAKKRLKVSSQSSKIQYTLTCGRSGTQQAHVTMDMASGYFTVMGVADPESAANNNSTWFKEFAPRVTNIDPNTGECDGKRGKEGLTRSQKVQYLKQEVTIAKDVFGASGLDKRGNPVNQIAIGRNGDPVDPLGKVLQSSKKREVIKSYTKDVMNAQTHFKLPGFKGDLCD
jgi:hypothetical protein